MKQVLLSSVAALLWAGAAHAGSAATTSATSAKPAAAAPTVAEVKTPTAQQQKMTTCNAEAGAKQLTGEARKSFMSNCLSAKPVALNAAQERMKHCNADAAARQLAGDARRAFMSDCLKAN
jgi:hypothetical protein